MIRSRRTTAVATVLIFALGGCARNTAPRGESELVPESSARTISITVRNNNLSDMKVFAILESGNPLRLGIAAGMATSTFTATPMMFPTGTLRLVATPVADRGVAESGPIQVAGGESVQFTIQSNPAASYALLW